MGHDHHRSRVPEANQHSSPRSEGGGSTWQIALILLTILGGVGWFLYTEQVIAGSWGYSLDDSWIYATYARNLATGQGYSFNPGEHVAGATGPLYVFILAFLYVLFHDVVVPAKILGVICHAASSIIVCRTVRRIIPGRGSEITPLLAGVLVGASPLLLWGSLCGLEIPVYLSATCIGIYFYVRDRWTLAVLSWSLGVWLRPDGLPLVLLGLFLRPKISRRNSIAPLTVAGLIISAYFAFNYLVGGWILPNSVRVAAHFGGNALSNQWTMVKQWADLWVGSIGARQVGLHATLLLPAIVVGSVLVIRRWPVLAAYLVVFPMSLAIYRAWGGQFGRYLAPMVPFGIILAVIGFEHASRRALGKRYGLAILTLGIISLAWQAYSVHKLGISHGWNVQNINGMHRYIAETTRNATSPGDTIAVNDVGAIGYFSGCHVVDLVGLVSPKGDFPENLSRYKPKYLIIFPDWFERFATVDWKTDQVVFYDADSTYKYSPFLGVRLRRNTISSRNTMYLYERMGRAESGVRHVPLIVH